MKSVRENSGAPKNPNTDEEAVPTPSPTPEVVTATPQGEPPPEWGYEVAHPNGAADLAPIVGRNLRRLRLQRGLSLERLSKASGVSRAMLGQIELGQSAPTINVLWKVSHALSVPFSALVTTSAGGGTRVLRKAQAKRLTSHDGTFSSRALFPFDEPRRVEFYELHLSVGSTEEADAHAPGTMENLVVAKGEVEIRSQGEQYVLAAGDSILFSADTPHSYRSTGTEDAVMYLVMTYAETVG